MERPYLELHILLLQLIPHKYLPASLTTKKFQRKFLSHSVDYLGMPFIASSILGKTDWTTFSFSASFPPIDRKRQEPLRLSKLVSKGPLG